MQIKPLIVFLFTILLISCNKTDYREKYVGNYEFTITYYLYDIGMGSNSGTTVDTGNVNLFNGYAGNNDDVNHKIDIILDHQGNLGTNEISCYNDLNYGAYDRLHPTVSESGELTYPEWECFAWSYHSYFSGTISSDTIVLDYGYYDGNHSKSYSVIGVRIN